MELWIRSQDKEILMKANRIDVDNKNIIVWDNDYHCGETYMGEYKSKERALEVLNEIERAIKCICVVRDTNDEIINNILKEEDTKKFMAENLYIYHMPEE